MADARFSFRPFESSDRPACLALFDANCPAFFAPNERADYLAFLAEHAALYEVCLHETRVVGAFGVKIADDKQRGRLSWIMIDPAYHGAGLGSQMMARARNTARRHHLAAIDIAASQHSAAFFARFGAREVRTTKDGWGPGMHRVDMEWVVEP